MCLLCYMALKILVDHMHRLRIMKKYWYMIYKFAKWLYYDGIGVERHVVGQVLLRVMICVSYLHVKHTKKRSMNGNQVCATYRHLLMLAVYPHPFSIIKFHYAKIDNRNHYIGKLPSNIPN